MDVNLATLADVACASLILIYAWDRFNTPASNRSSTRQTLYWWSCIGYMLSALTLFVALSLLLRVGPWRTVLLGSANNPSLPAPLIATLAMTTLLSSVPTLKHVDDWILSTFLNWAAIPAEVKRRAATMMPRSFSVSDDDVTALRDSYGDGSYGDTLAHHLCARGGEGLAQSQYRFTRVVKLYDQIKKLAGEPGYSRFFSEAADELTALETKVASFLRRSDTSLNLMERLRAVDAQAVGELLQERREIFAEVCRDTFRELALFLARAILRSETSEMDIVRRLQGIGFAASEPMNVPSFPIDSLTVLSLAMFLYLAGLSAFFSHVPSAPHPTGGELLMPVKITLARLFSVGVTVWLMQNYSQFRRLPGRSPHYFAYVLCGAIAGAASALVCLIFHLTDDNPLGGLGLDLPVILLSGILCSAVALCCDDWAEDTIPPTWLRYVEAAGCGSVMAIGAALVYAADLLPFEFPPLMLAAWIGLPSIMAMMIGGWVPHIYRSARRAALSQRDGTDQRPPSRHGAQVPVTLSPGPAPRLTRLQPAAVSTGLAIRCSSARQQGKIDRLSLESLFQPCQCFIEHEHAVAQTGTIGSAVSHDPLALTARLPAMYDFREHVDAGGLMSSCAPERPTLLRFAAYVGYQQPIIGDQQNDERNEFPRGQQIKRRARRQEYDCH